MKTNEIMKHTHETEFRNTDDGAKKSISKRQRQWEKNVLKSGKKSEIPQPYEADEKRGETGAEILMKTQKDTGVFGDSDARCLRSRKTGVTLNNECKR